MKTHTGAVAAFGTLQAIAVAVEWMLRDDFDAERRTTVRYSCAAASLIVLGVATERQLTCRPYVYRKQNELACGLYLVDITLLSLGCLYSILVQHEAAPWLQALLEAFMFVGLLCGIYRHRRRVFILFFFVRHGGQRR